MVEIAQALIDAIREQRAVLFLGAGASVGATHPRGESIPQGDRLRDFACADMNAFRRGRADCSPCLESGLGVRRSAALP